MDKIAITTGDFDGIGPEITLKALLKLAPPKNKIVIVGENLGLDYDTIEIPKTSVGEASYLALKAACGLENLAGIVTAPVSKMALNQAGHHFGGQTEVLESFLAKGGQKAQMLFVARDLKVMLLTRHLPLARVRFNQADVVEKTLILQRFLGKGAKIALCGMNPHAGEDGLLGMEEIQILIPAAKQLQKMGVDITLPLSADALFKQAGRAYLAGLPQKYDGIIAIYHDQGLAPLKALAGEVALNVTIGLDVVRTSPSHGTAKDIFGQNVADSTGMEAAIEWFL